MSIDIARFRASFYAEVGEHLQAMEDVLLDIDLERPDQEKLDALFRGAHSIKGGSGTFGLSELAEFTNVIESLLERVRAGTLLLTDAIVDAILRGNDIVREHVDAYRANVPIDRRAAERLRVEIDALVRDAVSVVPRLVPLPERNAYHVTIRAKTTRERTLLFDSLRAAFATLGTLTVLGETAADTPLWAFSLETSRNESNIRDLFAFASGPEDTIDVELQHATAPADSSFGFFDDVVPAAVGATSESAALAPVETSIATAQATTIRVNIDKVDHLVNLVGEMVIAEAMLTGAAERASGSDDAELRAAIEQVRLHTRDLRESVMSIRMLPIGTIFSRFRRVTRELATKLEKRVTLLTYGEETELDKGLIEKLVDPLTHLVRNSLDHGIESPEARERAGKDPIGKIVLRASHVAGNVLIEIKDDGAGLDRERILHKARERGMTVDDDASDETVFALIFEPGFSTAEAVTELSGRGVGMDVVRRNVAELGGRIDIHAKPGAGTTVTIRLPLTLAILDGLSVAVGDETFIVPLTAIVESVQPLESNIKHLGDDRDVLAFRDAFVPIVPLRRAFNVRSATERRYAEGILVVVDVEDARAALFVDALDAQHQVVIKSLETNFRRVRGIAGATVMGNGRVALIVDVSELVVNAG